MAGEARNSCGGPGERRELHGVVAQPHQLPPDQPNSNAPTAQPRSAINARSRSGSVGCE